MMIQQTFLQKCRPFLHQGQHDQLFLDHYGASVLDPCHHKWFAEKAEKVTLDDPTVIFFGDKMVSGVD